MIAPYAGTRFDFHDFTLPYKPGHAVLDANKDLNKAVAHENNYSDVEFSGHFAFPFLCD